MDFVHSEILIQNRLECAKLLVFLVIIFQQNIMNNESIRDANFLLRLQFLLDFGEQITSEH